jgi:hypothetical protein
MLRCIVIKKETKGDYMPRVKMFKNLTLREKYTMWLKETFNAVEVVSKTDKYHVMKTVDVKGDLFWFLGKSGAIRINRKNAATTSMDFESNVKGRFNVWCELKSGGNIELTPE